MLTENGKAWVRGLLAFGESEGGLEHAARELADAVGIVGVNVSDRAKRAGVIGASVVGALWDGEYERGRDRIAAAVRGVREQASPAAGAATEPLDG